MKEKLQKLLNKHYPSNYQYLDASTIRMKNRAKSSGITSNNMKGKNL